jgi:LuxR family maltose regulon positive regulatory protein
LRLTPAEGVAWLGCILAVPLTDREKLALVMRVDGWCAGLNLLALALKKQDDVHRFVATFEGQHPYFQEYFVEEILKNYPAEWQHFLLQTSILKQLTASLGDAVTGQGGSEPLLAQLCQANHFVALVDKMQGWYQYYPLFAQALQSQLAQQFPGQLTALHRRAAAWYQAHEFYSEAVHHLLQAGAWPEVAGLINRVILDELRRGIDHRLLKWLPQLPDELFIQHETLLFTYARLAMPSLPRQQVDGLLTRLSARLKAQPEAARTPIEQRLSAQLADWRQTGVIPVPPPPVDSADEVGHLGVMLDLMYQAFYRQQQGQVAASEAALWQALALGKASGMVFIIMVAGGRLAMRLAEQGRLRQSETLARDILQGALTQTDPLPVSASVALTALGRICYARNQMAQARHWLDEAVRLDPHPTSANTVIHHHGLLAHILQQQGHQAEAMGAMQAALELGPTGEFPLAALKAHEARLWLRAGEAFTAEQILRQVSDYPLSPADGRDGLLITAWAELLLAQQRYPEAESLLLLLVDDLTPDPILLLSPYPTLLLAIAYWGQQQINRAVQTLLPAIFMAEPEGIIRPFLDGGPPLIPLLMLSRRGGNLSRAQGHFVDQLLARLQALYPDAPVAPRRLSRFPLAPLSRKYSGCSTRGWIIKLWPPGCWYRTARSEPIFVTFITNWG